MKYFICIKGFLKDEKGEVKTKQFNVLSDKHPFSYLSELYCSAEEQETESHFVILFWAKMTEEECQLLNTDISTLWTKMLEVWRN